MGLGQSGPPASAKQLAYLQALLEKAGYDGFRDARRPLGLTQRQGSGTFTKQEASALIDRLVNGDTEPALPPAERPVDAVTTARADLLRGLPASLLAGELERRGWSVAPPAT